MACQVYQKSYKNAPNVALVNAWSTNVRDDLVVVKFLSIQNNRFQHIGIMSLIEIHSIMTVIMLCCVPFFYSYAEFR
jgi:hypothetical protein